MRRSRVALLTALGVDNFGSGLFLPVVLLYVTRVVGLPLAAAGTVVALGTVAGLAVPPAAGRLVDRIGPRRIVICAELLQALGAVTYLVARGTVMVTLAAVLLAGGQQLFYSSLFALIADVAGDMPRDRPFAVAAMVRSACFGLGGLAAAALLSWAGTGGYRVAVIVDAGSFAVCALLLALLGVMAPAVVALFSVAVWLPWLLVGAAAGLAVLALRWLAGQLPARVLRPESVRMDDEARRSAAAA